MKRQLSVVLVIMALIMTACGFLPGNDSAPSPDQTSEPEEVTYDVTQPDGVALTFLDAWTKGDYTGMYSLLSPNSQAEYTLEEFTSVYETTAATIQLIDLTYAPHSVAETTGTTAQFAFTATYNTRVLKAIEQELVMLLVLSNETWGVAWSPALLFPELAGGNTLQLTVETPSRANIYDRNGQWFVSANASVVTLSIIPGEVSDNFEGDMLDLLSEMLRMSNEEIRQQYAGLPDDWVVALGDVDLDTFNEYRNAYFSYPGLQVSEKTGRRYFNVLAPHLMGYVQQIPAEELEYYRSLGYQGDEVIGISGLEAWGENFLAGQPNAVLTAYTSGGQYFAEIVNVPAQPAQSVHTTLDRDLQAYVQDALEAAYSAGSETWVPQAGGASVVVMDINSGAILAMASYPQFDPNVMHPNNAHPLLTNAYLQELFNNPLNPFLNRSTQAQYPAGSVFKIVSAAAALDSGITTANWTYNSTGVWDRLGSERFDWQEGGHGVLNMRQTLTASCNTCFYEMGYLTGQQDFNMIPDYARQFGFGQETGIEIEEQPGLIPDVDWMWQTNEREWNLNDSVNIAIGQGDILVTPLQIAVMVSAVANGGTVYEPYLVDHIGLIGEDPSVTYDPETVRELEIADEHLQLIREAMYEVANDPVIGTAEYRLSGLGMEVAGKTGTAQVSAPGVPPIAWFAGYAPYENPEIAVVVIVENGGQGSGVAAPIFRRVIERWYDLRVAAYPRDWGDPELFEFVLDEFGD